MICKKYIYIERELKYVYLDPKCRPALYLLQKLHMKKLYIFSKY
jgi:hypothetical protein